MMRNKTSSSLQKTYDECYLICSTAVYFEGQNNEAEALRSWRSALDQIYYHNAYRVPAGYRPRSETEKALQDSLRDMEMQCKERVDLLEALKASRLENGIEETSAGPSSKLTKEKEKEKDKTTRQSTEVDRVDKGWIGDGSIPALVIPEISRPTPPLPQRPSLFSKRSSEHAVVGQRNGSSSYLVPSSSRITAASVPNLVPPMKKSSRSPSPEKRSMLTTLRSDKSGKKLSSRTIRSSIDKRADVPGASKAATLAWQSISRSGNKDKIGRSLDNEATSSQPTFNAGHKDNAAPESTQSVHYDSTTRRLVSANAPAKPPSPSDLLSGSGDVHGSFDTSNQYPFPPTDPGQPGAVSGSTLTHSAMADLLDLEPSATTPVEPNKMSKNTPPPVPPHKPRKLEPLKYPSYLNEYPETTAKKQDATVLPIRRRSPARAKLNGDTGESSKVSRKPVANTSSPRHRDRNLEKDEAHKIYRMKETKDADTSSQSIDEDTTSSREHLARPKKKSLKPKAKPNEKVTESPILAEPTTPTSGDSDDDAETKIKSAWEEKVAHLMKNLPKGVDEGAAKQIFNEIVVQGDEVHWDDVAGLEVAKNALKEAVVYPFLRPDLFMGLREPARGMLLFGPPGTGKTMLARAVATESRSTFFSISASSLTSKYLGESEKLVRALFSLAKALAPSIIFVDEIDSLLSSRSGSGEHEATRRIKTEFLIQWSDLQRAAAGREQSEKEKERGDASRVLVLAATNLPWAIDEAARRRFVRRQYIPLPEDETRRVQLKNLLGHQKHSLTSKDIDSLLVLTDGFSGSDITALAKDAAMGPLRSLGEALLYMSMDQIRPIQFKDFQASLTNIRPSVSKEGLKEFENWAREFGERGG